MDDKTQHFGFSEIAVAVFGFLAVVLVLAVAGDYELPIASHAPTAIIALALLGVALCLTGGIPFVLRKHGSMTYEVMAGMILGVVALLVLGCRLFGYHLPFIESDEAAFNALAILIMIKVVIAVLPAHTDTAL
jgi:hypothetical protein